MLCLAVIFLGQKLLPRHWDFTSRYFLGALHRPGIEAPSSLPHHFNSKRNCAKEPKSIPILQTAPLRPGGQGHFLLSSNIQTSTQLIGLQVCYSGQGSWAQARAWAPEIPLRKGDVWNLQGVPESCSASTHRP